MKTRVNPRQQQGNYPSPLLLALLQRINVTPKPEEKPQSEEKPQVPALNVVEPITHRG